MNVVIDIGNSYVKLYYDNDKSLVLPNTKDYYLQSNIRQLFNISEINNVNICSVVPEATELVAEVFKEHNINTNILSSDDFGKLINFGQLDYHNMGSDRVITTYSAIEKYGSNIIVVDLGTAITIDVVVEGTYSSGYIIPGSDLQKKSLTDGASMIDDFPFQEITSDFKALDTNSQISDGILFGICGSIGALIEVSSNLFKDEYKIILTGGATVMLEKHIGSILVKKIIGKSYLVDQKLMSDGLILASKKLWE